MSNQIVISSGAKVRNLSGVLTGTAGVVDALGINVPSGIPQLDGSGKILVSQLPNSVMEYKGTWNAATNTPTLVNGTGNQGDVYLVSVAGTVNFGAGPITFAVGDQAIYSGTIWQKAGGSTGTVTSVAVTESGDALTITGSPITTSGTINIGFAGTSGQYVNGAGGLTTFPSLTGFVPYTGATTNVDLGLYEISAQNAFLNGVSGVNGGNLFLKQDVDFGQSAGYTTLYSTGKNLGFVSYVGSFTYNALFSLNSLTNNSTRTYTLPDLSGTLALLEGSQTFTGKKTFSNGVNITGDVILSGGTGYGGGIRYVQGVILAYGSNETTTEFTDANSIKYYVGQGSSNYKNFVFDVSNVTLNATRTYNLPDASGTIALTSNLSSYVPYTGATANVNLGTFDLTADAITGATGSFASNGGSDTFAINHSSGSGIALNITKGGNGEGLYINKTSGSGNAATIIGTLNATTLVKSGGTSSQFLKADGSVDSNTYVTLNTTQTITGDKTFSGVNYFSGGTYFTYITTFTKGMSFAWGNNSYTAGYLTLASSKSGSTSSLIINDGDTQKAITLSFLNTVNTDRVYTFPNADGTLALTSDLSDYVTLGTNQIISGLKTFTALATNNEAIGIKLTSSVVSTNGYLTLNSKVVGTLHSLILAPDSTTNRAEFTFDNTALRTYALPNTSGTLALTSNLSAYLPLSGGTLTGPLSGTSATFNGQVIITNNNSLTLAGLGLNSINLSVGTVGGISGLHIGVTSPFLSISESTGAAIFSSNIGLGVTPSAWRSSDKALQINTYTSISSNNAGDTQLINNAFFNSAGSAIYLNTAQASRYEQYQGAHVWYTAPSGTAGNAISFTQAMTLDASGRLGIGTSSPLYKLQVVNSSNTLIQLNGNNTTGALDTGFTISADDTKNIYLYQRENAAVVFGTNNAERMRITSGGQVQIKQSANTFNEGLRFINTSNNHWTFVNASGNDLYIGYNGADRGYFASATGVYVPVSDINKKKDFEDSTIGLNAILGLKPTLYRMKSDDTEGNKELGFIAQEVKEFIPQAYAESGDFIGLNYNAIVAALTKAVQEQQAQIEELKQLIKNK